MRMVSVGVALVAGCLAAGMARSAEIAKYEGSYVRGNKKGEGQPLSAVFTPVAGKAGEWTVVFTARFKDKNGDYTGTATGDPAGEVKGSVSNKGGKRTWRFETKTAAGVMDGQHWETTGGKEQKTGSLTMKPAAAP
jgi:hypothetical protein